ncbi:hypothetical protein Tco_0568549 [Tanacetum coccineum]
MGRPFYGPNLISYFDRNDPMECALPIQDSIDLLKNLCMEESNSSSRLGMSNKAAKTRYNINLARLLPKQIYSPYVVDWGLSNNMRCAKEIEEMLEIKVYEIGRQQEIFTSKAWRRLFDINERIYTELCHEFNSTYTFNEVWLYHADEINDEGFEVYFQGGLRSDENFNAKDYWLSISSMKELHLSRSLASTIRRPILRRNIKNGYMNVAWLMAKWLKRKEVKSQRESIICCGQFITRIDKRIGLLTDEVLNSLSALTYCRALDATTLREFIGPDGRLIAEDP